MVLSVPAVRDRYYVMQFEDLYGQNDLYVGSRSTGTEVGTYFLAGPSWRGEVPEGFSGSHRFETDMVFLIGRSQLLGPADAPALAALMGQYRLEPYAVFAGGPAPELPAYDWPDWDDEASRDGRFLGYLNALLSLCQPSPRRGGDACPLRPDGIGPASPPTSRHSPTTFAAPSRAGWPRLARSSPGPPAGSGPPSTAGCR